MLENQVINKAIDYIFSHAGQKLSVEKISDFCGYSKFYLERLFKTETGESIYGFIKRCKVELSAFRLKVEKDRSITEIGGDYGYSPSNYAVLFRNHFNKTPAQFRKDIDETSFYHPFFHIKDNEIETYEECCKKIRIETLPDYFVLYERHKGNYHTLKDDWCNFVKRYEGFYTEKSLFIECTKNDPSITNPDDCIYDICMTVDPEDPRLKNAVQKTAAAGITSRAGIATLPNTMTLEGGKFAIYRYEGYPQQIYSAYQSFFCNWLAETGNHVDSRMSFDIYRRIDTDTLYMELDICIPIV